MNEKLIQKLKEDLDRVGTQWREVMMENLEKYGFLSEEELYSKWTSYSTDTSIAIFLYSEMTVLKRVIKELENAQKEEKYE